MASEAQLRANKKYLKSLDEIRIRMPRGRKVEVQAQAEKKGLSLNAYINQLIEKDMESNK